MSSTHSLDGSRQPDLLAPIRGQTAGRPGTPDWISPRHVRRTSNATVRSYSGALDISYPVRHSIGPESGQNAISSLLQAPIVRTGLSVQSTGSGSPHSRAPTTREIPAVGLSNVPVVDDTVFSRYLAYVGPLFESLDRAKIDDKDGRDGRKKGGQVVGRTWNDESGENEVRVRSYDSSAENLTALSTIPAVYFEPVFRLENPRVFDVVSEKSELVLDPDRPGAEGGRERKSLATNGILQEKMSWYIDTIEAHLAAAISTASGSFFATLDSLGTLQQEAAESVDLITRLRAELAHLDRDMAVGGLEIVGLRQRLRNLGRLGKAVSQLDNVMAGYMSCRRLVETGDHTDALNQLDVLEAYVAGRAPDDQAGDDMDWLIQTAVDRLIDLRPLRALDRLPLEIAQTRAVIGAAFEHRFVDSLMSDLRRHMNAVPTSTTLNRWIAAVERSRGQPASSANAGSGPAADFTVVDDRFHAEMAACLAGLGRSGYSAKAASTFRDGLLREIKNVIRAYLPSSSDEDGISIVSASTRTGGQSGMSRHDKSALLSRNLASLDPESAETMIARTYAAVGELLRRLSVQIKVILDIATGILVATPATAPQPDLMEMIDMSSLLGQAVDAAFYYVSRVLRARHDQTARLPADFFVRYITINRLLVNECEAVSGRAGTTVTDVVNTQIRDFLPAFADLERLRLQQVLDSDRWQAVEIDQSFLTALDKILESGSRDSADWLVGSTNLVSSLSPAVDEPTTAQPETEPTARQKHIMIGDDKYMMVESTVQAIESIERFCRVLVNIPTVSSAIFGFILDYLRLFNSRSCQLILGAGATRSAGLANINTRHLALAYLSLSFLIRLMDALSDFATRRLSTRSTFPAELDRIKLMYHEHQLNIEEKLIDIVTGRSAIHVTTLQAIDFDSPVVVAEDTSSQIQTLTRETNTLHRVLSRHLPTTTVGRVMKTVFANYRHHWGHAFSSASSRTVTKDGRDRLGRDARLFDYKLSKLPDAGDLGSLIVCLVETDKPGGMKEKNGVAEEVEVEKSVGSVAADGERPSEGTTVESEPVQSCVDEDGKEVAKEVAKEPETEEPETVIQTSVATSEVDPSDHTQSSPPERPETKPEPDIPDNSDEKQ